MNSFYKYPILILLLSFSLFGNDYNKGMKDYHNNDFVNAFKKFSNACKSNNAKACGQIGVMYYLGKGVNKNIKKSISFYKKACKGGDGFICMALAGIYERGEHVRINKKTSIDFYKKACSFGEEGACLILKNINYNQSSIISNEKKYFKCFPHGIEKKDSKKITRLNLKKYKDRYLNLIINSKEMLFEFNKNKGSYIKLNHIATTKTSNKLGIEYKYKSNIKDNNFIYSSFFTKKNILTQSERKSNSLIFYQCEN